MKVQLVVVRGKPEGRVIPLVGSSFKIGRGETCHLRPISEQISREHAEFTLADEALFVRDLGSRNGTLVNGKALTTEPCRLKDRDLVQVGPLTFAVSLSDVREAVPQPTSSAATKAAPEDVSNDEIDSWLIGERSNAATDQPTAVYGGDTITISAFKDSTATPKPPPSASDDEYERQPDDEAETQETVDEIENEENLGENDEEENEEEEEEEEEEGAEEFIDESNPFYAAKKAQEQASKLGPVKPSFKDTSDAAGDILRRLMERRKAARNE